ncbi:hypothetical protein AMELA_G00265710 [Ameiurus melas]|uniref:Uncharacterized protein n=1 Tax=Ameiurus melas TaxID=219545 RepID=A0A7J5ZPT4_AMEME|nr:hypothetical protein AMELA_G00265710 [Ameiurus melas]
MHTGKSDVRVRSKCAALLGMLGHHHGFAELADLTDLCWKQDERVERLQDADFVLAKTATAQEKAHPNKSHTPSFCMAPGQGQEPRFTNGRNPRASGLLIVIASVTRVSASGSGDRFGTVVDEDEGEVRAACGGRIARGDAGRFRRVVCPAERTGRTVQRNLMFVSRFAGTHAALFVF